MSQTYVNKVTYKIDLNKRGLSQVSAKKAALEEVGKFVVEAILDQVGEGNSPVSGENAFKQLSPEYKKEKAKIASPIPNLELTGSMLDHLKYRINEREGTVEVGIFEDAGQDNLNKADNHNKVSGESRASPVPKRRFIPDPTQSFKTQIENEISNIVDGYVEASAEAMQTTQDITDLMFNSIFRE